MFSQPTKLDYNESQKIGNIDPTLTSTNEEARALPWFVGRRPMAMAWLCEPFNQRTTENKEDMGKGGEQTTSHNVYVDIAAVICHGPIDGIAYIKKADEKIWEGNLMRGTAFFETIEVPGEMTARFHWGLEEDVDPEYLVLNGEGSTEEHPSYLGQFKVEFSQLHCGTASTGYAPPVPDIEVGLIRNGRVEGISLESTLTDGGINPVTAIAELLTNERLGVGWTPSEKLITSTWQETANLLYPRRDDLYVSLNLTSDETLRTTLGDALSYFDGFTYSECGKLGIGFYPHDGIVPTVKELTYDHSIKTNTIRPGSLADTINQVNVTFDNAELDFKENSLNAVSLYNRHKVGELRIEKVDRRHSILESQNVKWAQKYCHTKARPMASGTWTGSVHEAVDLSGQKLRPGKSRFKLDDLKHELDMIVRCVGRKENLETGEVVLDWEQERGLFALDYVASTITIAPGEQTIAPVANARVFELPRAMIDSPRTTVSMLVEKPSPSTQGIRVFYSDFGSHYDYLKQQSTFALKARLLSRINAVSWTPETGRPEWVEEVLDIEASGESISLLQNMSDQAKLDDQKLAIINNEVCSIGRVEVISTNRYRVYVARGRFATDYVYHSAGSAVWIADKESILNSAIQHNGFAQFAKRYFKLQTVQPGLVEPLEDSFVISHTFSLREKAPPIITFDQTSLEAETGKTVTISGKIEDQNEDIIKWSLAVIDGSGERNIGQAEFERTGFVRFAVPYEFLSAGVYTIRMTATDYQEGEFGHASAYITATIAGEEKTNDNLHDKDEALKQAWEGAVQYAKEAEERADLFREKILADITKLIKEQTDQNVVFDTAIDTLEKEFRTEKGIVANKLEFVIAKAAANAAAIVTNETAVAEVDRALAEKEEGLLATLGIYKGIMDGHADILTSQSAEIKRIDGGFKSMSERIDTQQATLDHDIFPTLRANSKTIQVHTNDVKYLNGVLTTYGGYIHSLQVSDADNTAKVSVLARAFIQNGRVHTVYGFEVDANGKTASLKAIALDDGRVRHSEIQMNADSYLYTIAGTPYKIKTEHAVAQITAARSYNGKSSWEIRNVFGALLRKKYGGDTGGKAEVLVYTADGS